MVRRVSFPYAFRLSGGFGQNFERLLSRGEWGFCPFSFKFGGFDRVPEALCPSLDPPLWLIIKLMLLFK